MAAIFVHALMLGRELTLDWYRMVWWLLGIALVVAVAYNWYYDKKEGKGVWKRAEK